MWQSAAAPATPFFKTVPSSAAQMHMHVADIQKDLGAWLQGLPVDGKW